MVAKIFPSVLWERQSIYRGVLWLKVEAGA